MVINADDPEVLRVARGGRARPLFFAVTSPIEEGVVVSGNEIAHRSAAGDRPLFPLSAVKVPGRHLLSDVLAASAAGKIAGVSLAAMRGAVESFEGLEHTLEPVDEIRGVRFVNDSKATNIVAAHASIECFDGHVVVIMGGRFKGGELSDIASALASRDAVVVAIGEARPRIRERLGREVEVREADTMADAVRTAFAAARPGGVVLLAPACASLDMFADYAERGRAFKKEVERLAREV